MSNLKPLADVSGRSQEATAHDALLSAGALIKLSVDSGQTLTIPAGYGMIYPVEFTISGEVANSGIRMVI